MCQACQSSFTAKAPIVQRNCFILKNVKAQVTLKSAEAQSLTPIARDCSVSPTTVQRQINQAAKQFILHYKVLPKHLSFDEFKYAKGEMAFEYINAESGHVFDILDKKIILLLRITLLLTKFNGSSTYGNRNDRYVCGVCKCD